MPTRDQQLLHLRVLCDTTAPARTRNALRSIPEVAEIYDDLLLIASGLVANAVVHSGCSAPDVIVVGRTRSDSAIRIWVDEPGHSEGVPAPRRKVIRATAAACASSRRSPRAGALI